METLCIGMTALLIKVVPKGLEVLMGSKITRPAQQRWLVKLMGFDLFVISCKSGKENVTADTLSIKGEVGEIAISLPVPSR